MMITRAGAGIVRRFCRDKKGASAIEFAIIGSLFLVFLFGLFGVALRYAGNIALEKTVYEAGRLVRTGQAQALGQDGFLKAVCEGVTPPLTCENLRFDVQTYNDFEEADIASRPEDEDNYRFQPGGRNDIVVVTAFYDWPLLSYLPNPGGAGLDNFVAAAAFRNEPF